jgi:hypothetical protein
MFEGLGKYLGQAFLIILGCVSYADRVKINLVLLVQPTTLYTEFQNRLPGLSRRNLQNIKICGWPREAVHHSHDEASHAIQTNLCLDRRIQFAQERKPRFRNGLVRIHTQDAYPPYQ